MHALYQLIQKYKKHILNSGWNTVDFFTSIALSFISFKLIIKIIGVDGFGYYTFFTNILGTLGLVDIGIGIAISKYIAQYIYYKDWNRANQVIIIGLIYYTLISMLIAIIVITFRSNIASFLNFEGLFLEYSGIALILISIGLLFNFLNGIIINIHVAFQSWRFITIMNICLKILNFTIVITTLYSPYFTNSKVIALIGLNVLFLILKFLILLPITKKRYPHFSFVKITKEEFNNVKKFIKFSSIQYLISLFIGHLDGIIISKYLGLNTLGYYNFCVKIYQYLHSFMSNIFKITFPILSKLHGEGNFIKIKKITKISLLLSLSISSLIFIAISLLWKPLIGVYTDPSFAISTYYIILLFSILLMIRSSEIVYYYIFNSIAKPKYFIYITAGIGVITYLLYPFLIPLFKEKGVILSTIIATCLTMISFTIFISRKYSGISNDKIIQDNPE